MATAQTLVAGRYRLHEQLGAGGMGRVWHARDDVLGRDVAIKEVVPPAGLSGPDRATLRQRTLREARTAARLSHPNVVKIYDVVHTEEWPWIVMEYVPSRSLQEVIAEGGPLSPAQTAVVGLAVLAALAAAHRAGVLHRDVKPGNVLIARDGRVVLTDFGLATFDDTDSSVTMPGLVLGSAQYVAPERARDGTSSPESDLWSLGATLYAAVEGRSPYARSTTMATLAALATALPDPPHRAGPLRPVLSGLLRRNPADRMTHVAARQALLRVVGESGDGRRRIPRQRRTRDAAPPPRSAPAGSATAGRTPRPGGQPAAPGSPDPVRWPDPARPPAPARWLAPAAARPARQDPANARTARLDLGRVETAPLPDPDQTLRVASPPASAGRGNHSDGGGGFGAAVTRPWRGAGPARIRPRGARWGRPVGSEAWARPGGLPRAGVLAAAVLAALLLAGLGSALIYTAEHRGAQAADGADASAGGRLGPHAPVLGTTACAAAGAPARLAAATTQPGWPAPPAGSVWYLDPGGFRIPVPAGWSVAAGGDGACFRSLDGQRLLAVQPFTPDGDPVDHWRRAEAAVRGAAAPRDYTNLGIRPVSGYFAGAAEWEYSYLDAAGSPLHGLDRCVVVSPGRAYAIAWRGPAARWQTDRQLLRGILAGFSPPR